MKLPNIAVNNAVINRQRCGQHNQIENMSGRVNTQQIQNLHERTDTVRITTSRQSSHQFIPRTQCKQHCERGDVEDPDPIEDSINCARNGLLGVLRFASGEANHFQAAEGEHDQWDGHYQTTHSVRQEAAMAPQVAHGSALGSCRAKQKPTTEGNHHHDRHHLDGGEPEFCLTKDLYVEKVQSIDECEEECGTSPGRNFRPPELDVLANCRQLSHADQNVGRRVVPTGQVT
ncbi:hypothetical protein D9M68_392950 [compost metagenome]